MIYIVIAAGIFLLEFFLKNYIEREKEEKKEEKIWGGMLVLQKYHNRGAFLNAGEKKSAVVALLSCLLTAVITVIFIVTLGQKGKPLLKAGLALLLGGAFSNTYDRLKRKYVVDYFSFSCKWKKLNRIVFNIADFCIMIGALMCALGWENV